VVEDNEHGPPGGPCSLSSTTSTSRAERERRGKPSGRISGSGLARLQRLRLLSRMSMCCRRLDFSYEQLDRTCAPNWRHTQPVPLGR